MQFKVLMKPAEKLEARKVAVDAERDRRMEFGFEFQGVRYQTRENDKTNLTAAAFMAQMAIIAGAEPGNLRWQDPNKDFCWIAADNSRIPMDAFTMLEFGKAAGRFTNVIIMAARSLKDRILSGEDLADVADDSYWR